MKAINLKLSRHKNLDSGVVCARVYSDDGVFGLSGEASIQANRSFLFLGSPAGYLAKLTRGLTVKIK